MRTTTTLIFGVVFFTVLVGMFTLVPKFRACIRCLQIGSEGHFPEIHIALQFDDKGRIRLVEPYYLDPAGRRVIHGELTRFDWELHSKFIDHYSNGEIGRMESLSIMRDGRECRSITDPTPHQEYSHPR